MPANANCADIPEESADDQLLFRILAAARAVHEALGPGFVENTYARALLSEVSRKFHVDRDKTIKIWHGSVLVGRHRLDLVVDHSVIVELKAGRAIIPLHLAQM